MAITREKVIRLALGQGGRLFPALAGRLAFELFAGRPIRQSPEKARQQPSPVLRH